MKFALQNVYRGVGKALGVKPIFNEAQRVYIKCGVPHEMLLTGRSRTPSFTKKGPGRYAANGKGKGGRRGHN